MLDDIRTVRKLDKSDMLGTIGELPAHLVEGLRRGRMSGLPRFEPKNVLVCGMGGSAIGGDLLREWMSVSSDVLCVTQRDYSLPPWAGKDSLVIIASYSGNTEETIAMMEEARRRRAKIVVISSGGKISDMASTLSIPHAKIITGLVPRASMGYIFGAMLGVVERAGLVTLDKHIEEALRVMNQSISECRQSVPTCENPAKRLAHEILPSIPIIIGYEVSKPVAKRWANQMNENGKSLAIASELPELDHNEIVGLMEDGRVQGFAPVFLDHEVQNQAMRARIEATKSMLARRTKVFSVQASGLSPLAKMLSLVVIGDYTSAYLGILRRRDPSSTEAIAELKEMLAKK